jgi:hypothetical protein
VDPQVARSIKAHPAKAGAAKPRVLAALRDARRSTRQTSWGLLIAEPPKEYTAPDCADPYSPQTVWYKVKNPAYTQAEGRGDLFHKPR